MECNCIEKNNFKKKLIKIRKEDLENHKNYNFYGTNLAYQEYLKIKLEIDKYNEEFATNWLKKNLVRYTINWKDELRNRYGINYSFDEYNNWKDKNQNMSLPELKLENLRLRKEIEYYSNTTFKEYKKWVEFDRLDNGCEQIKNIS